MIQPDSLGRSLWSAITPDEPKLDELAGEHRFDTLVIGGGLLGLSVALAVAEGGASVLLLEQTELGAGASGRNTGFVVPALKGSIGPDAVARLVRHDKVEPLLSLVSTSGDAVFDIIRRLGIDCSAEQTGCLQPAPTSAALASLERQVHEMNRTGARWSMLDAGETYRRTGIPFYHGAMLLPTGGQLNPLAYVRGLARAARLAGAHIVRGHVTECARYDGAWRVVTAGGGRFTASSVVLSTNALLEGLVPEVSRSLIPMRAYQVATQPLGEELRARILAQRQPSVDLRNHPLAVRWSPDNRLITGGGALWHGVDAVSRMGHFFIRRLRRALPDLPPLEAAFAWSGFIAGTGDFMPRVWDLGDGLLAPVGCNGRGVALTSVLGRSVGRYLLDGDEVRLPLPLTRPRPWRHHRAMKLAPSLWLAQARLRDWRNDRRRSLSG